MAALNKTAEEVMNHKVGIVIVSHNASLAVRITLASLRQARNETPADVLLIDNASDTVNRDQIRLGFERHVREASMPWEYIQLDKNLGFSGGNNVGIRCFLEKSEISHICLLNSDVIVSDYWLDRLVNTHCDIVSAVTNKAESEQCIPIDYSITLDECLDKQTECIPAVALSRVNNFARDWHTAWRGNLVEAEATFFCVLIARPVFQKIGLLDETFFPGGYEDDDFCLRARQHGYNINLARDVFIHHWGSASFSQLQCEYFNDNALRNLRYLEKKHGIVRRRRPEKPFVSYLMDIKFASDGGGDRALQRRYNNLYAGQLGGALEYFESEFSNLRQMITQSGREVPPTVQNLIERALDLDNLVDVWRQIASGAEAVFGRDSRCDASQDDLIARLEYVAEGIWTRVECNFAMHGLLYGPRKESEQAPTAAAPSPGPTLKPTARQGWLSELWWILKRGLLFLWNFRGIVFFGGYSYPERQSDGYFQRIQIVDSLFTGCWRVYVESDELPGRNRWFDRPEARVLVLRIMGGPRRRALVHALALIAVLKCRKIYFHSVLRMRDNHFGWLMHVPSLTKIIDIHGVVPEEFRYHKDFYSAVLYEREERLAVRKSHMVIVVTKAMESYLRQKYREKMRGRIVTFPMFPKLRPSLSPRPHVDGKPVVVYAGGLHTWQQVPKMIDAIRRTASMCVHRFYCPDPDAVRAMLPEAVRAQVIVDRKTHEELIGLYAECHYGFILRDDIVINHVACPTKLVEYLCMGIVPIVDAEDIGDFKAMGMQFVTLDALLQGSLPGEARRSEIAQRNFAIYERLREIYREGARDIRSLLVSDSKVRRMRTRVLTQVKNLFPVYTRRGRLARSLWRLVRGVSLNNNSSGLAQVQNELEVLGPVNVSSIPECDLLVQVDNFEAGGLENIVIDLNDALIGAGYKVVLVVLGTVGVSVQQARDRGMDVVIGSPEAASYRALIGRLRPRLVLAHYSIHGVELCHALGIPFVQVIQNIYMWLDDKQRATFAYAAKMTTVFIALSEYVKSYSVRCLGVDESRCIVLPCGIDCASFDALDAFEARRELRTKHGIGEQDFVFLSVGAINHQKNHIAAVRAFSAVATRLPLVRLVILGPAYEKNLREEIEHFIEKSELSKRVIYAGMTLGAQRYYAMADALVSASFFEGGPLILLEALKANLPVIVTNVGLAIHFRGVQGIEIVEPPVDIAEFRGAIRQLASTQVFEERLAAAMVRTYTSRQRPDLPAHVVDGFDKSNAYQCYVELIEHVLQGKSVSGKSFSSIWPNRLTVVSSEHVSAVA